MRAAIADMTDISARGRAYGIFNTIYGVAWFLGSTAVGYLYDFNLTFVFGFIVVAQAVALGFFYIFQSSARVSE